MSGWNLDDIAPGGFWYRLHEIPSSAPKAEVWKVIAICEEPTVTLENVETGDRETHVITSSNFRRFAKFKRTWADGSKDA